MSLILEALRKSEAERRRGQVPDIHRDIPVRTAVPRAAMPAWLWWGIATLLAAGVLLAALQAGRSRAPVVPKPAAVASRPRAPATALQPVARLAPVAQAPARAAPTSAPTVPARDSSPHAEATVPPPRPQAAPDIPRPLPTPAPAVAMPADDSIALSDLSPEQRKALPPLKLSMHLWNTDPAQRFVILDGNRLHEGDRAGDAVVTSITEDGVVLDWNGRRIRLSIR